MTNKQFYVYLHCRPDGTPFYVGKGSGRRAYILIPSCRKNKYHANIVSKYGAENIIVEVTACADEADAFEQEQLFILLCKEQGHLLVNTTDGGEGASGYKWTDCQKEQARKIHLGKPNGRLGTKHTEETKQKMRVANSGKKYPNRLPVSEETKIRMGLAHLGHTRHTKEQRHSISEHKKEFWKNNPEKLKTHILRMNAARLSKAQARPL